MGRGRAPLFQCGVDAAGDRAVVSTTTQEILAAIA